MYTPAGSLAPLEFNFAIPWSKDPKLMALFSEVAFVLAFLVPQGDALVVSSPFSEVALVLALFVVPQSEALVVSSPAGEPHHQPQHRGKLSRRRQLAEWTVVLSLLNERAWGASYQTQEVFEGGAGGLSKSKPKTGVQLSDQLVKQDAKAGEAQIILSSGRPVDISFDAGAWKALPGVAARDTSTGTGAFVLVASKTRLDDAPDVVFASDGKYGAYGPPSEIRLVTSTATADGKLWEFTFDALTPSMREVQKHILVRGVPIDGDVVVLVAGATTARWRTDEPLVRNAVDSFQVQSPPDYSAAMQSFRRKQGLA